ncbi:ferredoxin domain-containing protein [Aminicella lysinilytica]|jgi:uncharacterized ferredoxin-like protein|uniref:ferredoxin domain-containing protein n=1 Tax=Aminicella lysinilytica TaxID=433323 RepID=UPI0026E9537B|nr:DUF2148 domain-containing protein [Aminicella lysinilytica]
MIKHMENSEKDAVFMVADLMAAAARTAPKGSGKDKVVTAIVSGADKDYLVKKTQELAVEYDEQFFNRDAGCLSRCHCALIIGVVSEPFGLDNCSMCGFKNCAEMTKAHANCAFNVTDLGLAVGSAVSVASAHHIDNRVMYSIGRAAIKAGVFKTDVRVCYGIPLSVSSKSIFFDREPGAVLR